MQYCTTQHLGSCVLVGSSSDIPVRSGTMIVQYPTSPQQCSLAPLSLGSHVGDIVPYSDVCLMLCSNYQFGVTFIPEFDEHVKEANRDGQPTAIIPTVRTTMSDDKILRKIWWISNWFIIYMDINQQQFSAYCHQPSKMAAKSRVNVLFELLLHHLPLFEFFCSRCVQIATVLSQQSSSNIGFAWMYAHAINSNNLQPSAAARRYQLPASIANSHQP